MDFSCKSLASASMKGFPTDHFLVCSIKAFSFTCQVGQWMPKLWGLGRDFSSPGNGCRISFHSNLQNTFLDLWELEASTWPLPLRLDCKVTYEEMLRKNLGSEQVAGQCRWEALHLHYSQVSAASGSLVWGLLGGFPVVGFYNMLNECCLLCILLIQVWNVFQIMLWSQSSAVQ